MAAWHDRAKVHRERMPARKQPARRRLLHVLKLDNLRPHNREWRIRIHIGSHVRGIRPDTGEHSDPESGQDLCVQ